VKLLRKLSLPRLLAVVAVVVAMALGGTAIAIAARGAAPTPPAKPLAGAIHDSLAGPDPSGITARIKFTNKLFPSGALEGKVGSALMSGAGGRLWLTNDGRGRLELQSTAGDVQIVWNATRVTVYDASTNTVYTRDLPRRKASRSHESKAAPSIAAISDFLSKISHRANVSTAQPTNVAGRPAYSVSVSPQHDGGLLGSVRLAWDAAHGVPLRVAIYAQGASKPVLALEATDISYGPVPAANVDVSPPAGAKKSSLGLRTRAQEGRGRKEGGNGGVGSNVSGLAAVKAAAGFKVVAPDTLVGLPRKAAQLVGGQVSKTALLVYGEGLGAIVLAESPADSPANRGPLASLPTVSLDGATGHELATELGTALAWRRNGVAYVLAGSLPPAAAEAAARSLK
jgi:outer membrane lipoprotein-sorting protein